MGLQGPSPWLKGRYAKNWFKKALRRRKWGGIDSALAAGLGG